MSVPDFTGDVKRASRVVVRGQLPGTGEEVELEAEAFEARALQHEIDHCQGLLFLDRVAGALSSDDHVETIHDARRRQDPQAVAARRRAVRVLRSGDDGGAGTGGDLPAAGGGG